MAYILVDTREKDNDYVLKDFKRLQYNYEEIKLDEGDYQSSFNPNCVIDLKNGLIEVQSNIAGTKSGKDSFFEKYKGALTRAKNSLFSSVRKSSIMCMAFNFGGHQPTRFMTRAKGNISISHSPKYLASF